MNTPLIREIAIPILWLAALSLFAVSCASESEALDDDSSEDPDDSDDDDNSDDDTIEMDTDVIDPTRCEAQGLDWQSGALTTFESYPDENSEECIEFNGCEYIGLFAVCQGNRKSENWVKSHNIVAVFPDYHELALHDICVKSGNRVIVATVLDLCSDNDCDGCCTDNKGSTDQLIDVEKYTMQRFGVEDGEVVQWADLGPTIGDGCD